MVRQSRGGTTAARAVLFAVSDLPTFRRFGSVHIPMASIPAATAESNQKRLATDAMAPLPDEAGGGGPRALGGGDYDAATANRLRIAV